MSVEGLRAWIGEVERKLGKRTRVFLALAVIAIGLGGAALYLAIDTRNNAVSESDVQALQEKLETRIDEVAAGTTAATPPPIEAEPTPPAEETTPTPESGKGGEAQGKGGAAAPPGGASGGAGQSVPNGATGGAASATKLQELVEKAKQKNAEVEAEAKQGK